MSTMRAALYDHYGPPAVLYQGERPVPAAGPGQVLVRVRATSVNGGELAGRAGKVRLVTGLADRGFPKPTGLDFTGEVAGLGAGATGPRVGEPVWGVLPRRFGAAAEYVAVPPRSLGRAPRSVDLLSAAALPVGTTAITALRDKARVAKGERVLVRGASGGVGNVAVQLAKSYGARVTAMASAGGLDFVTGLGADEAVDYRTVGAAELGEFDVVLDTVGTDLAAYRRLLAPGGRMVTIAFDLNHKLASLSYIAASAVHGSRRVRFFSGNPDTRLFDELARLTDSGAIRPAVHGVHPLREIAAAHAALEAGGVHGKVLVDVAATG